MLALVLDATHCGVPCAVRCEGNPAGTTPPLVLLLSLFLSLHLAAESRPLGSVIFREDGSLDRGGKSANIYA